jgi:ABC-type Fe3+/spermidine/putrescine transport system ATPase subunit
LTVSYQPGFRVLDGIDLSVDAGAFFTLLGPSGCGKTTLLRAIAGFRRPESGTIAVGGVRIDVLPPHRRDIGMVFQDYAVFPHLSVADNVALGLRARRMGPAEIGARVSESLRMVRLEGHAERLPAQLSGGQQQRVGLARAMAIRPQLLLMDEPLSSLDAKLRVELREDIRDIQQRLRITTIYVTHDQEEALAVSDRICVMQGGRIEQVATPLDLYRAPATRFVAGFMGAMNFVAARVADGMLSLGEVRRAVAAPDGSVEIGIRPEDVALRDVPDAIVLRGTVRKCTFLGREAYLLIDTPHGPLIHHAANPAPEVLVSAGSPVPVALPAARILLFGPDGTRLGTLTP